MTEIRMVAKVAIYQTPDENIEHDEKMDFVPANYYRCSNKKYSCERTLQVYRGGREENRGNTGEHHIINKNS